MQKFSNLREKKAAEAAKNEAIQVALRAAKIEEVARSTARPKRTQSTELLRFVAFGKCDPTVLRGPDTFRTRTYNLGRRTIELCRHLYVKYPVPLFLYRAILSPEGVAEALGGAKPSADEGIYRDWFIAVAQGGSFAKVVASSATLLNRKEAHWFLQAPNTNDIRTNLIWSRAAAAEVPLTGCDYLVNRLIQVDWDLAAKRTPDLLRFYAKAWSTMRPRDRDEITDFVRQMLRNPEFSFKGRTYGSMVKLATQWHREAYRSRAFEFKSWTPVLGDYEFRVKEKLVRFIELVSNRAMADEGNRQRHCVFGYTQRCIDGATAIISLRVSDPSGLEASRLTIEVSLGERRVEQVRGRMNRDATDHERKLVWMFVDEAGLRLSPWAF